MSLKNILFPSLLIFAGVLCWTFLWPQYEIFRANKVTYQQDHEALQLIQTKRSAVEKLNLQVTQNETNNSAVLGYLADQKMEEKIIKQVNYAAASAGVFLDDIGVAASDGSQLNANGLTNLANPMLPAQNAIQVAEDVQSIPVNIGVQGDYGKLKIFFNSIQHLPIFNSLKALNIVVVEKAASSEVNSPKIYTLAAKLTVNFGYLKKVKAGPQKMANFSPTIDEETIGVLKAYISQDIPALVLDPAMVGVENPFLR